MRARPASALLGNVVRMKCSMACIWTSLFDVPRQDNLHEQDSCVARSAVCPEEMEAPCAESRCEPSDGQHAADSQFLVGGDLERPDER